MYRGMGQGCPWLHRRVVFAMPCLKSLSFYQETTSEQYNPVASHVETQQSMTPSAYTQPSDILEQEEDISIDV